MAVSQAASATLSADKGAAATPAVDRRRWAPVVVLLAGVCCTLSWLIPNHYLPWNSFYNESAMVLGLLLLTAAVQSGPAAAGLPAAGCAVAAVAFVPGLQWAAGLVSFSGDALVATLYLLLLSTAIGTGFAAARAGARDFAASLATVTLAAAAVSGALAMVQCLDVGPGSIWIAGQHPSNRGTGNLAQPNNLASLLGLGAVALWLLREQGRIGGAAAAALLLPLLIGAALSQSRTALLFGPVLLLLRGLAARRGVVWSTGSRTLLAVVALQWVAAWAWTGLAATLGLATEPSGGLVQRGVQTGRLQVWPVLFDGLSLSPWYGYGWLQTGTAQLAVAERHPVGEELFLHAHDIFLDLLLWCGWPLGLLLCALLAGWFASRAFGVATREAALATMAVAVLGVHALVELPHHYAYFLIPAGLWIGVVEAQRGSPARLPRHATALLATGCAALAVGIAWRYPAVEQDFRLVRFENLSIGPLRAAQPAPDAPLLSALTAYLRFLRTPPAAAMGDAELAFGDAVARRFPYSTILYRRAKTLALNGRTDEARQLFVKLRHIHGDLPYRTLHRLLHQDVVDGASGLAALDAALPD